MIRRRAIAVIYRSRAVSAVFISFAPRELESHITTLMNRLARFSLLSIKFILLIRPPQNPYAGDDPVI